LKLLVWRVPQCSTHQVRKNFRQVEVAMQVPPLPRLQPCGVGALPAPSPSVHRWPRRLLRHLQRTPLSVFFVAEPAALPPCAAAPPANGVPLPILPLALPSADAVSPLLLFYGAAPLRLRVPVVPCPPAPYAPFPSAQCQGSGQLKSRRVISCVAGLLPVQPSKPRVPFEPRAGCWPQRAPSASA